MVVFMVLLWFPKISKSFKFGKTVSRHYYGSSIISMVPRPSENDMARPKST